MNFDVQNYVAKCLALMSSFGDVSRVQDWSGAVTKRANTDGAARPVALSIPCNWLFKFNVGQTIADLDAITDVGGAMTDVHNAVKAADWRVFIGRIVYISNTGAALDSQYINAASEPVVTSRSNDSGGLKANQQSFDSVVMSHLAGNATSGAEVIFDGFILTYNATP